MDKSQAATCCDSMICDAVAVSIPSHDPREIDWYVSRTCYCELIV